MCISPLSLVTHSLIHKLTQAIMHTYVTLEPQMERLVQVDGAIRSDPCFPTGFMDVVSLGDADKCFDAKASVDVRVSMYVTEMLHDVALCESLSRMSRLLFATVPFGL